MPFTKNEEDKIKIGRETMIDQNKEIVLLRLIFLSLLLFT